MKITRGLLLACLLCSSAANAEKLPQVVNLADDFAQFWDETDNDPLPSRVETFKREVGSKLPAFYSIERFDGAVNQATFDQWVAEAITEYPKIRAEYEVKLAAFDNGLAQYSISFSSAFPDFAPQSPIYLLHSLGEMDGGTRTLAGRNVLIFGADVMAQVHVGWKSEAPFFHHELFHIYHEPKLGKCEAIWCSLWTEGLAIYVAEELNPGSSEAELLLTYPDEMAARTRAMLLPTLEALLPELEKSDPKVYSDMFNGGPDKGTLPRRREYYLGRGLISCDP